MGGWQNYTTEGYCFLALAAHCPSSRKHTLPTWKPAASFGDRWASAAWQFWWSQNGASTTHATALLTVHVFARVSWHSKPALLFSAGRSSSWQP